MRRLTAGSGCIKVSAAVGKAVFACVLGCRQFVNRIAAVDMDLRTRFGHLPFQCAIPMGIAHHVLEQPVPFTHCLFIAQRRPRHGSARSLASRGLETADALGPFDPKPVHRGDQATEPGQCALGPLAALLCRRCGLGEACRLRPMSQSRESDAGLQLACDFPAQAPLACGHVFGDCAAKPATGGKQRNSFENIGFASAVGP